MKLLDAIRGKAPAPTIHDLLHDAEEAGVVYPELVERVKSLLDDLWTKSIPLEDGSDVVLSKIQANGSLIEYSIYKSSADGSKTSTFDFLPGGALIRSYDKFGDQKIEPSSDDPHAIIEALEVRLGIASKDS